MKELGNFYFDEDSNLSKFKTMMFLKTEKSLIWIKHRSMLWFLLETEIRNQLPIPLLFLLCLMNLKTWAYYDPEFKSYPFNFAIWIPKKLLKRTLMFRECRKQTKWKLELRRYADKWTNWKQGCSTRKCFSKSSNLTKLTLASKINNFSERKQRKMKTESRRFSTKMLWNG